MKIKWLGHSCFKIVSANGIRVLTDPFDDNVGYRLPSVEADIVTISHNHFDHNFVDCVKGNFEVINKIGNFNVKDIPISGIKTYHDEEMGAKKGENIVYVFNIDNMRICHLGDLGHILTKEQVNMIGKIDILLIPVGGVYTIDAEKAAETVRTLKPSVVIPMHYKTKALKFELESADKFLNKMGDFEKLDSKVIEIKKENLEPDKTKVYVLKYE
ncbi:MAG TPA: MBL fold metallo-hydrolase [Clostridiaceae bacterium]|nr:MBL fold metallo-hydrolase [Clostridiaceae bacterium]